MDIEQIKARLGVLVAEMRSLTTAPDDAGDDWDMDADAVARFAEVDAEATALRTKLEAHAERLRKIEDAVDAAFISGDSSPIRTGPLAPPMVNKGGDPYDMDSVRFDASAADLRARVATGLERDGSPAEVAEAAVATLRNVHGDKRELALRCLATGSDLYRSAFAKLMAGNQITWSDAERQAVARAQSLTNSAGGFAVPFTLDPTLVLTNNSAINPIRNLARVVQITTNSWNGVTSAGATASWDAEAAEVSDDAITLAQPSIPVYKAQAFVPFSVEIEGDWASLNSDLRMAMMDARDRLEATAHIKGTGSAQPTGIEVELDGGSSELAPATAETFAAADVYEVARSLPPRYRMTGDMPAWVASVGTYHAIRQFDTGGGGNFWTSLGNGTPERLLGYRAFEASEVDDSGDIDAAATEQNFVLFLGDWSRYIIVDRVGMQVELVPHLFATGNNRPSGQRGLIGWWRTGAESIDDNAFRVMSIPTAA